MKKLKNQKMNLKNINLKKEIVKCFIKEKENQMI